MEMIVGCHLSLIPKLAQIAKSTTLLSVILCSKTAVEANMTHVYVYHLVGSTCSAFGIHFIHFTVFKVAILQFVTELGSLEQS